MAAPTTPAATLAAPAAARSPWPVFWIASVAVFLVSLDATVLFAAFDALRRSFAGASAAELSWVLNACTVVYASVLIPAGGLADAHGRKQVFLLGVALFLAASAACGLAGSFVVDAAGWPWAFCLNLPLGALALWFGARRLEASARPAPPSSPGRERCVNR